MKNIRVGSAVIIIDNKFGGGSRILLGQKKKNGRKFWVIPGGKINYHETINHAAIREIKEETGLTVEIKRRVGVYELIKKDDHRIIVYSLARVLSRKLRSGDDLYDARWFTCSELSSLKLNPFIKGVLHDIGYL